jgi:hypothetical protein
MAMNPPDRKGVIEPLNYKTLAIELLFVVEAERPAGCLCQWARAGPRLAVAQDIPPVLSEMYGPPPICKWIFASGLEPVCCNVSGP